MTKPVRRRQAGYEEDVPPEAFVLLSDAEVEAHLLQRAIAEGEAEDAEERSVRGAASPRRRSRPEE